MVNEMNKICNIKHHRTEQTEEIITNKILGNILSVEMEELREVKLIGILLQHKNKCLSYWCLRKT